MAKIINFKNYKKHRPNSSVDPSHLDECICLLIKFIDDEKTQSEYEITGNYCKSKLGRTIIAETLLIVARDILNNDDPAVILELAENLKESIYNNHTDNLE